MEMDGRGGCCIARYISGGVYDTSKIDRIMSKFRPIAPKPAAGDLSGSSGSSGSEGSQKRVNIVRGKRKYVKRNNNGSSTKKRKVTISKNSSGSESVSGGDGLVTLSLLPEMPEKYSPARKSTDLSVGEANEPILLSFNKQATTSDDHVLKRLGHVRDQAATVVMPEQVKVVGSFVTVECVTDTWVDGNGIGCTDEERMFRLETDTCPGFISDGHNRVLWTNKAYRTMAGQVVGKEELMVWVVMKEWVTMPVKCPAFTCKVRVTCGKEKTRSTPLTVPCDVWRMENGGYAWRLDVKAALSLGR